MGVTVGVTDAAVTLSVAIGGSGLGVELGVPSPQAVNIISGAMIKYGKGKYLFAKFIPLGS